MYAAKLRFDISGELSDYATDAVLDLLCVWQKNGQLVDYVCPVTRLKKALVAYVLLPDDDSLAIQHSNQYGSSCLAQLAAAGLKSPKITSLGFSAGLLSACRCKVRQSQILFTTYLIRGSPLRCGDCFQPIPLYLTPHTEDHDYSNLLQWAADCAACDTLQMHCTVGELFAERQLANVDSQLSLRGRHICRAITNATGVSTYYFLMKSRARSFAAEERRMCPCCGNNWRLEEPLHEIFDFRCDDCALLSNIAYTVAHLRKPLRSV